MRCLSLGGTIRVLLPLHTPSQSNDPLLNSLVNYLFVGLRRAGHNKSNKMAADGARGVPSERGVELLLLPIRYHGEDPAAITQL